MPPALPVAVGDERMDFVEQIKRMFESLSVGQRWTVAGAFGGILIALGVLGAFLNSDSFTPLYVHLSADDAARVVEQLKTENVAYRLSDGGTTIKVPSKVVFDVRLKMSMAGLPSGGGAGFELFDKAALGMTDFTQQVNYQRAIQGELSRTIAELGSVKQAKVHLVFNEASPFFDDDKAASASVVLTLQPGAVLDKRQIQGIVHLVSGAVKGLHPENVTVVDGFGVLLSGGQKPGSLLATGDQMLELQHNVEDYLEHKGMSMLDRVLGPDKAVLRVSAILDTQVIKEQSEVYDPSSVVRSEQQMADRGQGNSESSLKNFEVGKTVRQVVASPGNIKKLNISLVVDGIWKDDPANPGKPTYSPRPEQELKNLSDLVKQAVGFSEDREDKMEARTLAFDTQQKAALSEQFEAGEKKLRKDRLLDQVFSLAGKGVVAGAMLAIAFFFFRTIKQAPLHAPLALPGSLAPAGATVGALPAQRATGALPAAASPGSPGLAAPSPAATPSLPAPSVPVAEPGAVMGDLVKAAKENPAAVAQVVQRSLARK